MSATPEAPGRCSACSATTGRTRWASFRSTAGEDRSLCTLRKPADMQSMTLEVETGVDPSLLTALLVATDQLLLNHKLHDYAVDWKGDLWLLEACAGTEARKPGDRRPPAPDKRTGCLCLGSLR